VELTGGRFVKYWLGSGKLRAHVDAIHAALPRADLYSGEIAVGVALRTGCACIVATVSRTVAELNRPPSASNREAVEEYRRVIRKVLEHCGILDEKTGQVTGPYLHLAVRGLADRNFGPFAVEIGTRHGESCSEGVYRWLFGLVPALAERLLPAKTHVLLDRCFVGDPSKVFHHRGDGRGYAGYGPDFNTVQVEISLTLRKEYREAVIEFLSCLVREFNSTFLP